MRSTFAHLAFSLGAATLALACYGIAYAAAVHKSVEVAGIARAIEAETLAASRIASARTALSEIEGSEQAIESYFVSETEVVRFITDIEERGAALGADVSVSSVERAEATGRPKLEIRVSVHGTFDAVMRTFGSIEFAPYDLSIIDFSIKQDIEDTWRAEVHLQVGAAPPATGSLPHAPILSYGYD